MIYFTLEDPETRESVGSNTYEISVVCFHLLVGMFESVGDMVPLPLWILYCLIGGSNSSESNITHKILFKHSLLIKLVETAKLSVSLLSHESKNYRQY